LREEKSLHLNSVANLQELVLALTKEMIATNFRKKIWKNFILIECRDISETRQEMNRHGNRLPFADEF
jgi:hypothetical protein